MALHPWFDRTFTFDLPLWMAPNILERLRGTAPRAEDRLRGLDPAIGIHRTGNAWSVHQHIGHLGDLEPLWMARVEDLRSRRETLIAADLQNRVTDDADHNARSLSELLARFRSLRTRLVAELEATPESDWGVAAIHPRLQKPMRLLDHAFFVAEHDDHHLAKVTELLKAGRSG